MKKHLFKAGVVFILVCLLGSSVLAADNETDWSKASDWAKGELTKASEEGLIPGRLNGEDMTLSINRAEFAALAVKLYEAMSGKMAKAAGSNPFTDTSDAEILKAYSLGIVKGMTAATFEPKTLLDREQAATMLARAMTSAVTGLKLETAGAPVFADDKQISNWARTSVLYMSRRNIVGGFKDNTFRPRNTTDAMIKSHYANATREQAVIIAYRCLEASKIPDNIGIEAT